MNLLTEIFKDWFGNKPTSFETAPKETAPMKPDLVSDVKAGIDRVLDRAKARKDKVVEQQAEIERLNALAAALTEGQSALADQNTAMARELDRMEGELEAWKQLLDAEEPEVGGSTSDV